MLVGFGTGLIVLAGTGGGFILAPALLIFFNIEPAVAAGTTLALVAVNSLSGTLAYRRTGLIDRRSGLLFAAAAIPGSVLAPFVIAPVGESTFRILFGLLLVAFAIQMVIRLLIQPSVSQGSPAETKTGPEPGRMMTRRRITARRGRVFQYEFNEALATSVNIVFGFMSSFFGTGGGFLRTPILVYAFSFPVRVAVATSVFALTFYTTTGALTHASLGHVDWYPTFLWAGIGLAAGAQIGARLAGLVRGRWILRLLLVLILAMGVRLLIEGLQG